MMFCAISTKDENSLRRVGPGTPATSSCSRTASAMAATMFCRSEEHTSELQSRLHLVCRLLLEKKKYSISNRFIQSSNDPIQSIWPHTATFSRLRALTATSMLPPAALPAFPPSPSEEPVVHVPQ